MMQRSFDKAFLCEKRFVGVLGVFISLVLNVISRLLREREERE